MTGLLLLLSVDHAMPVSSHHGASGAPLMLTRSFSHFCNRTKCNSVLESTQYCSQAEQKCELGVLRVRTIMRAGLHGVALASHACWPLNGLFVKLAGHLIGW